MLAQSWLTRLNTFMSNIWALYAAGNFLAMSDRAQGFEAVHVPYSGNTPTSEQFQIINETETRYVNYAGMVDQMSTPQFTGGVIVALVSEGKLSADLWTPDNISVLNMYIGGALARRRFQQIAISEADVFTRDTKDGPVIDARLFKPRLRSL